MEPSIGIVVSLFDLILFLFRAADWKLDAPDWTGRLRVVAKGKEIFIKLEDKISGCVRRKILL